MNIRLNANTGSWDWDTLANDWDVVDLEAWGLEIPCYNEEVKEEESNEEDFKTLKLNFSPWDYKNVVSRLEQIDSKSLESALIKALE